MDNETQPETPKKSDTATKLLWLVVGIVVAVGAITVWNLNSENLEVTPLADAGTDSTAEDVPAGVEAKDTEPVGGSPLLRQTYFEEAFRPNRESYNLFEQAAQNIGLSIDQMPAYFGLKNESEIFEKLPAVPEDFSEIAYLLASGRYFDLGQLDEAYYLQPEFYPNFQDQALKFWTTPDGNYWGVTGYGTYPAEEWDTLDRTGRRSFTAVTFFHTGWNVQTWQGVKLVPNADTLEYFDIQIEPDVFLLGPTFSKFESNWVEKIVVTGTLKEDTPPGEYTVGINLGLPPEEMREAWGTQYRNLYFDAASGLGVSGNQIQLNIKVK